MTTPIQVEPITADKLRGLARTYRDAAEVLETHRNRLHDAVAQAEKDGMKLPHIARIIGVSTTRVYGILARVYKSR
jgi:hypothetical protein